MIDSDDDGDAQVPVLPVPGSLQHAAAALSLHPVIWLAARLYTTGIHTTRYQEYTISYTSYTNQCYTSG